MEQRPVHIRVNLERPDVVALAPLFEAYRAFYGQAPNLAAATAYLLERWERRETVLYGAFADDAPVGFAHLFPSFASAEMRRLWILNDLFVVPAWRRAGVAAALLERVERHARETDAYGVTLSTAVDNHQAQALYRRTGYERDDDFFTYNLVLR